MYNSHNLPFKDHNSYSMNKSRVTTLDMNDNITQLVQLLHP